MNYKIIRITHHILQNQNGQEMEKSVLESPLAVVHLFDIGQDDWSPNAQAALATLCLSNISKEIVLSFKL